MTTWLASRRATLIAIALALAVAAPTLRGGFVTDDHGFRAIVRSTSSFAPPAWDLFRFQSGDPVVNTAAMRFGHLVWWAAPDLKIHFARPLTSLLFAGDVHAFGDSAIGYHAHSLAWLLLLLAGVAVLYRRVLAPEVATVAVALFGLASAHTEAYAWLSARHALVGAAGAAWALALYARGGRSRWLGIVPCVVGLAGSESALAVVPIWCALACARESTWRRRVLECLPIAGLAVAYAIGYHALGFGTRASGGYHDPFSDPAGFAVHALATLPVLLGDATLCVPSELAFIANSGVLVAIGAAGVVLVAVAWWLARPPGRLGGLALGGLAARQGLLGWLALGGLAALLPGVAGFPVGRALVVPDLAFAAVLAAILVAGWQARGAARVLAVVLAVLHLVAAPLLALAAQHHLVRRGALSARVAAEARALVPDGSRAIVIAASDPFVFMYPRAVLADVAPHAVACWSVLSAAPSRTRLTRTGDRTFSLDLLDAPIATGFDALFRSPDRPFAVGDHVDQCGASITVAEVSAGHATKLSVSYQRALDDPKLAFLAWRGGHLEHLAFPGIGASVDLPR